jgi:hypothetical protein
MRTGRRLKRLIAVLTAACALTVFLNVDSYAMKQLSDCYNLGIRRKKDV